MSDIQIPPVASLFETRPPTAQEVQELQQMLDRLRKGKKS